MPDTAPDITNTLTALDKGRNKMADTHSSPSSCRGGGNLLSVKGSWFSYLEMQCVGFPKNIYYQVEQQYVVPQNIFYIQRGYI